MADEVRLQFVLLDEVLLAREIDAPIDVLGVVARHIFAMACEFHRKPGQRRLVGPRQVADHQPLRVQMAIRNAAEHVRVEIAGEDAFGHILGALQYWSM